MFVVCLVSFPTGLFCRMDWDDRSSKLGAGFRVNDVATVVNDDYLRRARALYDTVLKVKVPQPGTPAEQEAALCVCILA